MKACLKDITRRSCQLDRIYEISGGDPDLGTWFQFHSCNRETSRSHVGEIAEAMEDGGTLSNVSPIEVNIRTRRVVDGQHRLKAFQKLVEDPPNGQRPQDYSLRVSFLDVDEETELKLIRGKNCNLRNWSTNVMVKSYVDARETSWIWLGKFCEDRPERLMKGKKPCYPTASVFVWGRPTTKKTAGPKPRLGTLKKNAAARRFDEVERVAAECGFVWKGAPTEYQRLAQAWYEVTNDEDNKAALKRIGMDRFVEILKLRPGTEHMQSQKAKNEWVAWLQGALAE